MTHEEIHEILRSEEWIKIDYKFNNSTGTIIIKKELYNIRWKKIKRLFKDVIEIVLDDKYNLKLEDIINMDREVNALQSTIRRYDEVLKNCIDYHRYCELRDIRDGYIKRLDERLKEIKEEYNDRS